MFNYGDLDILTAAEQTVDRYHMLNSPKEFKKTMLTQKHALETEFMSPQPPTPPLRASAEQAPAAPPAPQPQPAPQIVPAQPAATGDAEPTSDPAPGNESLEVTQTLARLSDLRDQGAITPEEYEQKKSELLGRL
jgi:hypothetical protein